MTDGIRPYWKNFIGGEWRDGGDGGRITVTDPATASRLPRWRAARLPISIVPWRRPHLF